MLNPIEAKEPNLEFSSLFFHPNLQNSKPYKLILERDLIKLDQNESPFDWPSELKKQITDQLMSQSWSTYPQDYPSELKKLLADSLAINPDNIVLSPGSNYHITVLLNLFSTRGLKTKLVLTRPSFPLFEGHCRYHNIPYEIWPLDEDFNYNLKLLPKLEPGSCVFFASPNNPVGNTLKQNDLIKLLESYPDCYFIADEAYWEFADENNINLLENYSNLLILRTFSKAMSSAGLRFSYILASKILCEQIKKVTLPFIINKFTSTALELALKSPDFRDQIKKNIEYITEQRESLYKKIRKEDYSTYFRVLNSKANFLCFVCHSESYLKDLQDSLRNVKILGRNVSAPGLPHTLRVTIGLAEQNQRVLRGIQSLCSNKNRG